MRSSISSMRSFVFAVFGGLLAACGDPPEIVDATAAPPAAPPAVDVDIHPEASNQNAASPSPSIPDAGVTPCPEGMVFVDANFCPDIDRRCLEMEHERTNHLEICHAFAHEEHCRGKPRRMSFCIDRYEYPNRQGAHPVWMLDWYEAQATCESQGKRLCGSNEWTAACEGPKQTPFPYGFERDHWACNMDNFYIEPMKPGPHAQFFFYSKDRNVALKELSRLDQSVPSGSIEKCRSGFGVNDMTGNMDEWVSSDEPPREKSKWAGLKGGAWGHVRSQCRPMTYSHEPEFRYYFVGFRCCRNAEGDPPWMPSREAIPPPQVEEHDFAPDPIVAVDPPGPSKTKFTWVAKKD